LRQAPAWSRTTTPRRACCRIWKSCASTWWAMAAPPALATPDHCLRRLEEHRRARAGCGQRAERQPQLRGRVNVDVRANYLMSPPLVVAYALAGNIGHHFETDSLGADREGKPVYLKDIWPTQAEWPRRLKRDCPVRASAKNTQPSAWAMPTGRVEVPHWRRLPVGAGLDLHPQAPYFDASRRLRADHRHCGCARAGGAG